MVRPSQCGIVLATLLCLGASAGHARADLYLVTFQGSLDTVDPALAGTFSIGQALTGSYVFESSTPARAGSNSTFAVYDALKSLSVGVGGYTATSLGAPEIQVDNNPPGPDTDRYGVVARASDGLVGASVGGEALDSFAFRLDDSTNSVFSTALVLPTSLSLSSFDSNRFFFFFGDIGSPKLVSGTLSGLSVTAVPEPGSLSLGLTGVLAVGLIRFLRIRGRSR